MLKQVSIRFALLGALLVVAALYMFATSVSADSNTINFENPPYTVGSPNGQDGWSSTGSAGSGCATYDHAISTVTRGFAAFGSQTLRISNAVTSGCFGDNTFSKSLVNEAGETGATNGGMSGGTRQARFEAQFDFTTALATYQPGLAMSVSPDRGDGSRQSYLRFQDDVGGIDVFFVDVQGTGNPANFVETQVANDLSRATVHTAKFVIDYVNGPSNDVAKIYIDGLLVHTGTTWENYYRFDSEAAAEQTTRTTDSLIFRTGGTAVPTNAGNGFLFDNLTQTSGPTPPDCSKTTTATFTTTGTSTFVVPAKYCSLTAEAWGAGGGGGGDDFSVSNGPDILGGDGKAGQNSTFLTLIGGGGNGGLGDDHADPRSQGGAGGIASGGDTNTNGAAGVTGMSFGGKGGSAPNGGAGGAQVTGASAGNAGSGPGGAGGGGSKGSGEFRGGGGGSGAYVAKVYSSGALTASSTLNVFVGAGGLGGTGQIYKGGNGAPGKVVITYTGPSM